MGQCVYKQACLGETNRASEGLWYVKGVCIGKEGIVTNGFHGSYLGIGDPFWIMRKFRKRNIREIGRSPSPDHGDNRNSIIRCTPEGSLKTRHA